MLLLAVWPNGRILRASSEIYSCADGAWCPRLGGCGCALTVLTARDGSERTWPCARGQVLFCRESVIRDSSGVHMRSVAFTHASIFHCLGRLCHRLGTSSV